MSRETSKKLRRVVERSIPKCILLSICTFGLYYLYWIYEITKESKVFVKPKKLPKPSICVFFSVITLGLFLLYWSYRIMLQHLLFTKVYKLQINKKITSYFTLFVIAKVCGIIGSIIFLLTFCFPNNNDIGSLLTLIVLCLYIIKWCLVIVALSFMQNQINIMVNLVNQRYLKGVFVYSNYILDRPIISFIVLVAVANVLPSLASLCFRYLLLLIVGNPLLISIGVFQNNSQDQFLYEINNIYSNSDSFVAISIFSVEIIVSLCILLWFKLTFKRYGYNGVLGFKNLWKGMLYASPALIYILINAVSADMSHFSFGLLVFSLIPAFTEEIASRGMVIPNLMRTANPKYSVYLALFLPALVFGLSHFINIISGNSFSITVYQFIYTTILGLIFGAAILKTGNLWPCIIYHFTLDFLALSISDTIEEGLVQSEELAFSWVIVVFCIILLLVLIYVLFITRPSKHEAIFKLWEEKWGFANLNTKPFYNSVGAATDSKPNEIPD